MLALLALAAYPAVVERVVDGDTIAVRFPAWAGLPIERLKVRVAGIDTPETHKPPGKCRKELVLGAQAKAFAQTLAHPGDAVQVGWRGWDKYGGRVDAALTLADGTDYGAALVAKGLARPYDGGRKSSWCRP